MTTESNLQRAIWRRIHILSAGEKGCAQRLAKEYCSCYGAPSRSRLRDLKHRFVRIEARLEAAWDELHALLASA